VIECQVLRGELFAAILTGVVVSCVDVGTRELDLWASACPHILQQTHDGRELEREGDRANLTVMRLDDFDLALRPEDHSSLPVHDIERLKRCVKK
jgi:hypothetical protein